MHKVEIEQGRRFEFGGNWQKFLQNITPRQINKAQADMCAMLDVNDLANKTFLDVGSGSGLSSLVAKKLGAQVVSFDYDPISVNCTRYLKQLFFANDQDWVIYEGSALDKNFLEKFSTFDIVYSWGVLHHTGQMWQALNNIVDKVADHGSLFCAIYNDQGWISSYWKLVKRLYCQYPVMQPLFIAGHFIYPFAFSLAYRLATRRINKLDRGMTYWRDYIDWLGGYPFEVATSEAVLNFLRQKDLELCKIKRTYRSGCNQYIFRKK